MLKRIPKKLKVTCIVVGIFAGGLRLIFDGHARPFCHKQIMLGLELWMDDQKTNAFPNLAGHGSESIRAIIPQMGGHDRWVDNYRYIPGLRLDDPGDLLLLYVAEPTRWTWHGDHPTVFRDKAWVVVPVDFTLGQRNDTTFFRGELSEQVPTSEFIRRLKRTLEYLKEKQRPGWDVAVAEHSVLLQSLQISHSK